MKNWVIKCYLQNRNEPPTKIFLGNWDKNCTCTRVCVCPGAHTYTHAHAWGRGTVCVEVVVRKILWKNTKKSPRNPIRNEDSCFSLKWILENPHHLCLLCFNIAKRLRASDVVKDQCPVHLKVFPSPLLRLGSLVLRCGWRWVFLVEWVLRALC